MTRPVALIILDGWGIRTECTGHAVCQAHTPRLDELAAAYPTAVMVEPAPGATAHPRNANQLMEDLIGLLVSVVLFLFLLGLGFFVGWNREQNHLRDLDRREADLRDMVVTQ